MPHGVTSRFYPSVEHVPEVPEVLTNEKPVDSVNEQREKSVALLHPDGSNLRALRSFLQKRGCVVVTLKDVDDTARLPKQAAAIVHADILDARVSEALSSVYRPPLVSPLLVLVPRHGATDPCLIPPHAAQLCEPYHFESLMVALETTVDDPQPDGASTDPRAMDDLMRRVLQSIGHGLSTPLVAAQGWLDMVLSDIDESDPLRRNLKHVSDELTRATELSGLLSGSRQTKQLDPQAVRLSPLVFKAARLFDNSPVRCVVSLDSDIPEVLADGEQLAQALEILLGAIHRSAGTIDGVRISAQSSSDRVTLSITEIGRGFRGSQPSSLCRVGRALLDHAPPRGLAYPVVHEMMGRMNIPFRMVMTSDRELLLTFEFKTASAQGKSREGEQS